MRRRRFLVFVAATPAGAQSYIDNAKTVVEQSHRFAELRGQDLANEDMFNITYKVLLSANDVASAFQSYQRVHADVLFGLENKVYEMMMKPDLVAGSRDELKKRYEELKIIIRARYEASWIPTTLDQKQEILALAFSAAAKEMRELAVNGRAVGQNQTRPAENFFGGPENTSPPKTECSFMANSPTTSTDSGTRNPNTATYQPGDKGSFFFSCPGPEGQNDWIRFANYFGEGASLAFSATLAAPNPYTLIVGIALAALSLISGTIGVFVSGSAIEDETRRRTEADMYQFLHVAVPEDISAAYKKYATANVGLLEQAADDVSVFLKGPANRRAQLLAQHRKEANNQNELKKQLHEFEQIKCRMNTRLKTPKLTTNSTTCPIETGEAGVKQAADDATQFERIRASLTIEKLWSFVRYQVVEMLQKRDAVASQAQERVVWKNIDASIEKQFLRLMGGIDVVNDLAQCERSPETSLFRQELETSLRYVGLRSRFFDLVGDAVKMTFGDLPRPVFVASVTAFERDLQHFITTEGAVFSGASNLARAVLLVKQRYA